MMKESYKKAVKSIEPDMHMESRLLEKIKKPEHRIIFYKKVVLVSLILMLAISGFIILPLLTNQMNKAGIAAGNSANIVADNTNISSDAQNVFTLFVYAAEDESSYNINGSTREIENYEKTLLNDIAITLQDGKISRGEYVEWTHSLGEKAGQLYRGYTAGISGNSLFGYAGQNIMSVSFESTTGSFSFWDYTKRDIMERNGELYIAKIFLDKSFFDDNYDVLSQFKKLWNDGFFDDYKEQYFEGKSTNLDDYSVSIGEGHAYDEEGNEISEYENVFDKKVEVPINSKRITISMKGVISEWLQNGKSKITVP